ncbi:unnamed protein product [Mytilus edulis]|uniref:Integrase zinc-binding domain-containing protein n=1 Tax=Mytilus edulis TaxID=6550 RepID=A0A8S3S384_MYTED|nr:unnamed protein product [Mytilus edulis]
MVTKWVETDERPNYKDVSDKGFFLRSLWNQWNNLELRDGLIYRRFEDPATKIVKMQAIIPLSERKKVLQFSHVDKCSAHLGIHKTLAKIRQSYYWPELQNDARTYVNGCDKCAKRKSPQKSKRALMALVEANGPMERIATDILGELPETESVHPSTTTGQTPNSLMLGRELSTPLDIMYEMPPSVKDIPAHKWAWELKEKLNKNKQTLRTESDNNTFVPLDTENNTAEDDEVETPYLQQIAVHESTMPDEDVQENQLGWQITLLNSFKAMQSFTNSEDLLLNVNSAIVNPYDGFAHGAQGIRQYHIGKMKKNPSS